MSQRCHSQFSHCGNLSVEEKYFNPAWLQGAGVCWDIIYNFLYTQNNI